MDNTQNNQFIVPANEQFSRYLKILAGSGIFLMIATVLALIWANSDFEYYYNYLWHHVSFSIGFSGFMLEKDLIHWINDGLMAVFFFVVGLEIKREVIAGELNTLRKASLPLFAAIGGMIVPIAIFFMFGLSGESKQGWGVPMATDIAFSIGVLAMLGKRVPISIKVFLTALAIVDDLGAVLVIAFFYTHSLNWLYLLIALGLVGLLFAYNFLKGYSLWIYTGIGFIVWFLFLKSGVHATIAGVLIAFTIPVYPRVRVKEFLPRIKQLVQDYLTFPILSKKGILNKDQYNAIDSIGNLSRKVQSPLQFIEHDLNGWVNYLILPIFAFANAGVNFFAETSTTNDHQSLLLLGYAIPISMVLGKVLGIFIFSWMAVKFKVADKPDGVSWLSIAGVGILAGIGFTMSTFIATLAFDSVEVLNIAKKGIFIGSLIAGLLGYIILRFTLKNSDQAAQA